MQVEFPVIVFRKLLKVMEGWGDTLLFGFQPDGVEIQANKDYISMIFVKLDMELVASFDPPSETIARCVKKHILQHLVEFVGDDTTISLGCDHTQAKSPLYILVNNKNPCDRDIRVSVRQPETESELYVIPEKHRLASRCYILTEELQRITTLFSIVCRYFTFSFKSTALYLISKEIKDIEGKNIDKAKEDNPHEESTKIFEDVGIEIELPFFHEPNPKLRCASSKIVGKKVGKMKKVKDPLINRDVHATMDLRHFNKVMVCVASDPPKYMLCQMLEDRMAPFEMKYTVSNMGTIKIYVALILEDTK